MKMKVIGCILSLFFLLSCSSKPVIQLHTLGDSTMEQQDPNIKDQRGWPQFLQQFFSDEVKVVNHGKSGSSTKTFYNHGFWDRAKSTIQPGDYVIIQFAHNDGKHGGEDGEVGTAPTDSFRIYLSKYVNEVRELGAHPILMTPVVRQMFDSDGKLSRRGKHDLGEYFQAHVNRDFDPQDTITYNYTYNMKFVADSLKCPLIDMCQFSTELVEKLGPEYSTKLIYDLPNDGTHFGASGALLLSELAAKGLKQQNVLAEYIKLPVHLAVAPVEIDLGDRYTGTTFTRVFNVGCLNSKDTEGNITVNVTGGFTLSTEEHGEYQKQLTIPYSTVKGVAVLKLYMKVAAAQIGKLSGVITVSDGKNEKRIPVSGQCIALDGEQEVSAFYTLYNHSKPATTGAVVALEEQWSNLEFVTFVRPRELGVSDPDGSFYNTKVQCNNIIGGQWPGNEIDVVHSRYVQFGIQAIEGSKVVVNHIGLTGGGGVSYRIMYSKNDDFSDALILGERIGEGNEMTAHSFDLMQEISNGEKLYLRIYPWSEKQVTPCYLCLYKVQIDGIQTLTTP